MEYTLIGIEIEIESRYIFLNDVPDKKYMKGINRVEEEEEEKKNAPEKFVNNTLILYFILTI